MHGNAGSTDKFNTGKDVPIELAHRHLKKHILEANEDHDVDIFMHSWSTDHEKELLELYNPTDYIIEPQIIFDFEYSVGNPNKKGNPNDESGLPNRADFGHYFGFYKGLDNLRFHSMFSKWYSAKIANDLKIKHEEKNGFTYDYVFLTRYDLAYIVDIKFSEYNKDKFYVIGPDNPGVGYNDLWFFSDSKKMDVFCKIYDFVKKIKHFPHKHVGNHFLARRWVHESNLNKNVEFVFNRPWDSHQTKEDLAAGRDVGPAPPVRRWYELEELTPQTDMQRVREHILNISKRTISD